jgi:hypothetical protein
VKQVKRRGCRQNGLLRLKNPVDSRLAIWTGAPSIPSPSPISVPYCSRQTLPEVSKQEVLPSEQRRETAKSTCAAGSFDKGGATAFSKFSFEDALASQVNTPKLRTEGRRERCESTSNGNNEQRSNKHFGPSILILTLRYRNTSPSKIPYQEDYDQLAEC